MMFNITNWILCMAKTLIDGLQLSRYAFIVLYIYAYAHKSSYHYNKINWFLNLLKLTIYMNYQFALYRTGIPSERIVWLTKPIVDLSKERLNL